MPSVKTYEAECILGHKNQLSREEFKACFGGALLKDYEAGRHIAPLVLPIQKCSKCKQGQRSES